MSRAFVTVVSGVPRSGTSLLMQMLGAGGLPLLTDGVRAPDEDNPRGYFELEAVKALKRDAAWLSGALGKAVKAVHVHLADLPRDREYRVIFVRRPMAQVLASQRAMLARRGKAPGAADAVLTRVFEAQVATALAHLKAHACFRLLEVEHAAVVADAPAEAARIDDFLGGGLNRTAMAAAVVPALH